MSTDKEIDQKSLSEEKTAVKAYTSRKKTAKDKKLKEIIGHALGEEKEHAKMFGGWKKKNK